MNKLKLDEVTAEELRRGYQTRTQTERRIHSCVFCGKTFEDGEIYPLDGRFFEAERAVQHHIEHVHPDRFERLLGAEDRYVPLTENQKEFLRLTREGLTDAELSERLKIAPSTVRHQRFMFREREKQAKMFLAIYALASEIPSRPKAAEPVPAHPHAIMVDDRYNITADEREKFLKDCFESISPLKLRLFSAKEKKKIVVLNRIAEEFERNRDYTEPEVNDILREIYGDYVTIRRYLIEYGYMDRTNDCSKYWMK